MNKQQHSAVIVSVSSDIGLAMAGRWLDQGISVAGTYRTMSSPLSSLVARGLRLVRCDLADPESVPAACGQLAALSPAWDWLVMCPGAQEPVGLFADCSFDEWNASVQVNFLRQMEITHRLLPHRNRHGDGGPAVLYFAGGGTNNATVNYSAYTVSKIALIKMCELLDAEVPDTRFAILGPGWVKTKIHEATLKAGPKAAGANYQKTMEKLAGDECTPMDRVLDCCDWILTSDRDTIGGRNFSVVFDAWDSVELPRQLRRDCDMYKLRRNGNGWRPGPGGANTR